MVVGAKSLLVALTMSVVAAVLIGSGLQADAQSPFPLGCITIPLPGGVACPTGSPGITAAAPVVGAGVDAVGNVYVNGNPSDGVSSLHLNAPIIGIAYTSVSPSTGLPLLTAASSRLAMHPSSVQWLASP
jgi:hypothetical protein